MSDEMKLLRAFIEASGYDIEDTVKTITIIDDTKKSGWFGIPDLSNVITITTTEYKVTKRDVTNEKR